MSLPIVQLNCTVMLFRIILHEILLSEIEDLVMLFLDAKVWQATGGKKRKIEAFHVPINIFDLLFCCLSISVGVHNASQELTCYA